MQGGYLWKHGRHGKPKVHYFHLTDADTKLTWMSKDSRNRSVDLNTIKEVRQATNTCVQGAPQLSAISDKAGQ